METKDGGLSADALPIDIHYNKLLDWLIDRKHCNPGWQAKAYAIREKISHAVQDMPAVQEITELLRGSYVNYYHCLRIVELLKVSEADTKNFFGQYSSKRMKDWKEILQLYEKDSVFLSESASMLSRNVNYEIPATKRQIAKCQQVQRECSRKESDCASNAALLRSKFLGLCKELKIEGRDVKFELRSLVDELPSVYLSVCEEIKGLCQCVEFYEKFVAFVAPSATGKEVVTMIKFIQEHGNATAYQWKTGKVPDKVLAPVIQATVGTEEDSEAIDWGVGDDDGIDFGEGVNIEKIAEEIKVDGGVELEVGEIDFGDDDKDGGAIDWGTGGDDQAVEIEVEGSGCEEGSVVSGEDAEGVIANSQTRNLLINELLELQAFFSQRLEELNEEPSIISTHLFQSAFEVLQLQTPVSVSLMQRKVTAALNQLTSPRTQHLFMIKSSQRYIDRLAESLLHKLTLANKMEQSHKAAIERAATAAQEQSTLEPKLNVLKTNTRHLQKQVEESLSKRYNSRIVNIMGEINSI
eukprot:m.28202 g.28202  ORF g.28202 m.28202 type:complete len:524 (+) comp30600_c0_seq4:65-1636(+)